MRSNDNKIREGTAIFSAETPKGSRQGGTNGAGALSSERRLPRTLRRYVGAVLGPNKIVSSRSVLRNRKRLDHLEPLLMA